MTPRPSHVSAATATTASAPTGTRSARSSRAPAPTAPGLDRDRAVGLRDALPRLQWDGRRRSGTGRPEVLGPECAPDAELAAEPELCAQRDRAPRPALERESGGQPRHAAPPAAAGS